MRGYLVLLGMGSSLLGFSQELADTNLYTVKDTLEMITDTVRLIETRIKVGHFVNQTFNIDLTAGDTIIYSIAVDKGKKLKYRVIDPSGKTGDFRVLDKAGEMLLPTPMTGNYIFEFKNNLLRSFELRLALRGVHTHTRKLQIKSKPLVKVTLYDTVPRMVLQGTYYIGSRRNVKSESRRVIEFKFAADSVPCYWAYVVGFGKDYESSVSQLVDLKTQAPVGDPLVAHFSNNFYGFPRSESRYATLNLSGPGFSKNFSTTDFDVHPGRRGVYSLTVDNRDEVLGEYIYLEVMAFDFIKKDVITVPLSEYRKMKIARCSGN